MGSTKTPTNNSVSQSHLQETKCALERITLYSSSMTLFVFSVTCSQSRKKINLQHNGSSVGPNIVTDKSQSFQHSLSPCSLQQFFYVPSRILFILNSHPLISCFCLRKVETNLNHIKILEKKLFFSQCSHFRNGSRSRRWRKEFA